MATTDVSVNLYQEGDDSVIEFRLPGAVMTLRYSDEDNVAFLVEHFERLMLGVEKMVDEEIIVQEFIEQIDEFNG